MFALPGEHAGPELQLSLRSGRFCFPGSVTTARELMPYGYDCFATLEFNYSAGTEINFPIVINYRGTFCLQTMVAQIEGDLVSFQCHTVIHHYDLQHLGVRCSNAFRMK